MAIPVQCTHCLDVLNLKDSAASSIGKKMRCPKCEETFVIRRHRSKKDEVEDYDEPEEIEDDWQDEDEPRSRSRRGQSASRGRQAKAKKPASSGPWKVIGSVAGSILVVALIVLKVILRARNNQVAEVPPAVVQPATATPAAADNNSPTVAAAPNANSSAPSGATGASIPDSECEAFAKQFEARMSTKDASVFQTQINWDKLMDRSMSGLALTPAFIMGFKRGATAKMATSFSGEVLKAMGDDGHYRYLRCRSVGAEKRILFRLAPSDGGVNYHDLVLGRGANGQIEIVDFYVLMSGELMSETLHGIILITAINQKGSFLQKLTGQLSDFEAHLPTMNQFTAQKNAGQFVAALATFKRLPPSLQKNKAFALARTMVASNVNEAEYLSAMTDFRQAFPNDTCIDFLSIDFFTLRKEFDKCLEAVNRVDQSIGGDPFLNLNRANVYIEQAKFQDARRALDSVIQAEPKATNPVYALAGLGLQAKDYVLVLEALKTLKEKHQVQFEDLRTVPEYADFVKSPQYQEWLRIAG